MYVDIGYMYIPLSHPMMARVVGTTNRHVFPLWQRDPLILFHIAIILGYTRTMPALSYTQPNNTATPANTNTAIATCTCKSPNILCKLSPAHSSPRLLQWSQPVPSSSRRGSYSRRLDSCSTICNALRPVAIDGRACGKNQAGQKWPKIIRAQFQTPWRSSFKALGNALAMQRETICPPVHFAHPKMGFRKRKGDIQGGPITAKERFTLPTTTELVTTKW